ncbi:MAG: MBL fold metallo-hydrolase [Vicinamibacterales bacterium]
MKRAWAVLVVAAGLTPMLAHRALGQDAGAAIDAASAAMGVSQLQTVRFTATGSMNPTGQAYETGGAWPRFTVTKYSMAINFAVPAMRQELVRIDDARPPRGGGAGGYNPTTFQGGIRPIPGDIVQNQNIDGRTEAGALRVFLTPHGFLRGADANRASATVEVGGGKKTITFRAFGKYVVRGVLSAQNLVERVETTIDIDYTGDTPIDGLYSEYRDFGGVKFPMRITQREGGFPVLDLTVASVDPNNADAQRVGAEARPAPAQQSAAERLPEPEKVAEGVWILTPGIEGSILVEFKDFVVILEAPVGEAYSTAALARAAKMFPAKPIRYVVNTHHHADHAAGMRTYVAEGIPIVTHASHQRYYEQQIFRNPHALRPDRLARSPRPPRIETMTDKRVISDGAMSLELHVMRDQPHSEGLVMAYLPAPKLLVQADAYHPRPGAPPLPAPSPYTISLADNVRRLKLDVDRVVHIHGGISPYADVLTAAGQSQRASVR